MNKEQARSLQALLLIDRDAYEWLVGKAPRGVKFYDPDWTKLDEAFSWNDSPQGSTYWSRRSCAVKWLLEGKDLESVKKRWIDLPHAIHYRAPEYTIGARPDTVWRVYEAAPTYVHTVDAHGNHQMQIVNERAPF